LIFNYLSLYIGAANVGRIFEFSNTIIANKYIFLRGKLTTPIPRYEKNFALISLALPVLINSNKAQTAPSALEKKLTDSVCVALSKIDVIRQNKKEAIALYGSINTPCRYTAGVGF
jgi:hypothetical protein